jgi:hypothetical protein
MRLHCAHDGLRNDYRGIDRPEPGTLQISAAFATHPAGRHEHLGYDRCVSANPGCLHDGRRGEH